MLLTVRGEKTYVAEIPKAELSIENLYFIDYQVCAKDGSNTNLCTQVYTIMIADFQFGTWFPSVLYPNQTYLMDIQVRSVNGFDQPIDLSMSGLTTQQITATFEPSHVIPIPSDVRMAKLIFGIRNSAPAGEYYLTVTGKSGTIKRSISWTLSIPDFKFAVAPSSATLRASEHATFNMTLSSIIRF